MAVYAGQRTRIAKHGQDRGRGRSIDCPQSRSLGYHEAFPILKRTCQGSPTPKIKSLIGASLPTVTQRTQSRMIILYLSYSALPVTPGFRTADLESGAA